MTDVVEALRLGAAKLPVRAILSGPSTGVVAAQAIGALAGFPDLITFDMGGTSTDISVVRDGRAMSSQDGRVGDFPLMMPVTAIEAIGAGGGSIAWMDGPVLKMGPRSAGARPGPAATRACAGTVWAARGPWR